MTIYNLRINYWNNYRNKIIFLPNHFQRFTKPSLVMIWSNQRGVSG